MRANRRSTREAESWTLILTIDDIPKEEMCGIVHPCPGCKKLLVGVKWGDEAPLTIGEFETIGEAEAACERALEAARDAMASPDVVQ